MGLRLLVFGTPAFAVPTLDRLLASAHTVAGVVTQPDRRRGRGQHVVPGPVRQRAAGAGLAVLQPARLSDPGVLDAIRALDADLAVVAAYGRLLPQALLDVPRLGFINVHASLLPRWRGAAPVHRAILAGDRTTGVTIMRVVLELDAGPMLARQAVEIGRHETSVELEARLADLGAAMALDAVDRLEAGPLPETAQDPAAATYAPKLTRADSRVDWTRPAQAVHDQIRGLHPWPHAAVLIKGRRVALLRSDVLAADAAGVPPGSVAAAGRQGLDVAAGSGTVRLLELQPADRRPMTARAFLSGEPLAPGDRLEPLPDAAS